MVLIFNKSVVVVVHIPNKYVTVVVLIASKLVAVVVLISNKLVTGSFDLQQREYVSEACVIFPGIFFP